MTPQPCYHFKSLPTETHGRVTVVAGTVNHCEANLPAPRARQAGYTMTLTSTNLQGWITVSGEIEPSNECGSCGTGGGGNPQDQNFDVTVTQRVAWAYFSLPANGTNLTACAGCTNTIETKVVLGDAGIPSEGTLNFSANPSTLGTFLSNNISLTANGTASTSFIASTNSGSGTITASASGLKDEQGKDVPNVSTNLVLQVIQITQFGRLWWFGGEPTPPNFTQGATNCTLTANGASEGIFKWDVTAGTDKVNFDNGRDTITKTNSNTATLISTAASQVRGDVSVVLTYNGVSLCTRTLEVRAPKYMTLSNTIDLARGQTCNVDGTSGWATELTYTVFNQFDEEVKNAPMNEKFGTKTDIIDPNNWGVPTPVSGETNEEGVFQDVMCYTGSSWNPSPVPPQSPLMTNKVYKVIQEWYCGSSASGKGVKVRTHDFVPYLDHGRHE